MLFHIFVSKNIYARVKNNKYIVLLKKHVLKRIMEIWGDSLKDMYTLVLLLK